ncbi:MAG: penicillin-binding protein 2 [Clostridia bacterium]|nr:penicillin-binding protein 2 [Clostridia bacterium]
MNISYKRIGVCYCLVVVLLFICAFRVFLVMNKENYKQAAEQISRRVVSFAKSRGTIFDANMEPITNATEIYYIVIFDEPSAIAALYSYFSGSEIEKIINDIRQNGFAVRKSSREIICDGIYNIKTYSHADDSLLSKHIIGYTDLEGKGVCGIESAFDSILFCEDKNQITFTINGQGRVVKGYTPELNYNYSAVKSGVQITIDKNIQRIAEQKSMEINCGAVVICDIQTGKIKALVSRPDYKLSDLGSAVKNENEPLLNRALCTYNIGSVFKPFVAAVGYETGKNLTVECKGYTNIDGLSFACHNTGGHGSVDLSDAIKFSCNSYFYTFIQSISTGRLFSIAKKAGMDSSVYLADGLYAAKGNLGETNEAFLTKRNLANISIGQGELMTSPIAITNIYMAIASGGSYVPPSLIEGIVKNEKVTETSPLPKSIKLFSKSTADKLRQDLAKVLEGTGKTAKPKTVTAAGKTGTAQTGVIKAGKKVTNSWFCGFFPLDNPKYAVTVLSENTKGGVGHIFAEIADAITEYELTDSVD